MSKKKNRMVPIAGALLAAGICTLLFKKNKPVDTSNDINEKRILTLHPAVRDKARQFIAAAKAKGIDLLIASALRTFAEQDALFAQGRTTGAPGKIVTKAKAGQSSHNFGTAIDVVPLVNGKADWNTTLYPQIAQIGKSIGFSWGGDWTGGFVDKPHFEMNFGKSLPQLLSLYAAGKVINGYVNIS